MNFSERLFIVSIIISCVDKMGALLNNEEVKTYSVIPGGAVGSSADLIKQDIESIEVFSQEYLSEEAKMTKEQELHQVYYSPDKEQQQGMTS